MDNNPSALVHLKETSMKGSRFTVFLIIILLRPPSVLMASEGEYGGVGAGSFAEVVVPPLWQESVARKDERPRILFGLYFTLGAVQALDAYTTSRVVAAGGREVNPLLESIAGNPGAMLAMKTGSTAAIIYFVERLWPEHRLAAVLVTAGITGTVSAIAVNNARMSGR